MAPPQSLTKRYPDRRAAVRARPAGWRPISFVSDSEPGAGGPPTVVLAVIALIGTEVMFFGGLISAFYILRAGSFSWSPIGQPRLPIAVTGINTLILFGSGIAMRFAVGAAKRKRRGAVTRWLVATLILGAAFLAIQGSEWMRLIQYRLTVKSSLYGALFYAIVGAHAVHVVCAIGALLFVTYWAGRGRYSNGDHDGLVACSLFWQFVVLLWGVLYATVYLG